MKQLRINDLRPLAASELQLTPTLCGRRYKTRRTTQQMADPKTSGQRTSGCGIAAATIHPDVIGVIFLFIIGCLMAANLILRFPDAGLLIAQFNEIL
jgi:hypothetical protein